jgi:hypothetical protein
MRDMDGMRCVACCKSVRERRGNEWLGGLPAMGRRYVKTLEVCGRVLVIWMYIPNILPLTHTSMPRRCWWETAFERQGKKPSFAMLENWCGGVGIAAFVKTAPGRLSQRHPFACPSCPFQLNDNFSNWLFILRFGVKVAA